MCVCVCACICVGVCEVCVCACEVWVKLHARYLAGGRSATVKDEVLYRFEFPEVCVCVCFVHGSVRIDAGVRVYTGPISVRGSMFVREYHQIREQRPCTMRRCAVSLCQRPVGFHVRMRGHQLRRLRLC